MAEVLRVTVSAADARQFRAVTFFPSTGQRVESFLPPGPYLFMGEEQISGGRGSPDKVPAIRLDAVGTGRSGRWYVGLDTAERLGHWAVKEQSLYCEFCGPGAACCGVCGRGIVA